MTKFFKYCFEKWWRPLVFFSFTFLIFGISEIIQNPAIIDFSFFLLLTGLLGLLISVVYQLSRKKWLFAILTISTFGLGILGFLFFAIADFWITQSSPDRFADDLKIPANINIHKPKVYGDGFQDYKPELVANHEENLSAFELYRSVQPGIYDYEIWMGKIDQGTVFLKAFEIIKNERLSKDRLTQESAIKVENPGDTLIKFRSAKPFTIYEGDWGKPYAARFEVWYQPDNGKERKLTEKNYVIEGWQR